jgi:16S rRNA (cytosine1402-N4)-methyltransferase
MHTPVLTDKVLEYLDPKPNQNFIDCTAGQGGHTLAILERTTPKGKVLAIDWDTEAITRLVDEIKRKKLQNRITLINENYAHVKEIVQEQRFGPIAGMLLDLGFSSDQLNQGRGLSFLKDEVLDMRYSTDNPITAEKLVNFSSHMELEHMFKEYGEEQFAEQIAKAIVGQRKTKPIRKTFQLVHIIHETVPRSSQNKRIHAATKVFQALRIAVNNELENIQNVLQDSKDILPPGSKIAVISFHSLEDRIVKEFFKAEQSFQPITKKPVTPSLEEIKTNPRARSAKLRVAIKL